MILLEQGPGGLPALFAQPQSLIVAWQSEEVDAAFAAMAAAQKAGFWLAGYASYELGYALEPRLRHLMPPQPQTQKRVPLLAFEVHHAPTCATDFLASIDADTTPVHFANPAPDWNAAQYATAFERLQHYIAQGDCYQANLTFSMRAHTTATPQSLYAALRRVQPVPFGAWLAMGVGPVVLSRSPELFFRLDSSGKIEARPMKGTMPRHPDPAQDAALAASLKNSAKNRAENIMIVDLLRNDMGRLCEIGSVQVPELFNVQSYATVHQMISRVLGQSRPGLSLSDLFRALFPCGSVTGAPKIRAMEIIRELEPAPRGVYCGSIGWIAPDGSAELNVAIRTLSLFDNGEVLMNVGGGVVYDSTAAAEYEEALWKARFAHLG